jgi:hypothetical protein
MGELRRGSRCLHGEQEMEIQVAYTWPQKEDGVRNMCREVRK